MPRHGKYQKRILIAATTAWLNIGTLGELRDLTPLERSARQLSRGGVLEHYGPRSLKYKMKSS